MKRFRIFIPIILLLVAVIIGFMSNSLTEEPDLSLLHIDNALSSLATGSNVIVETEDHGTLSLRPHSDFLKQFNQRNWKEKRVNSSLESSPTLKIYIHDGYYINFYSYENYAMVYFDDSDEKYRYYTIPDGTYKAVEGYVLDNGNTWDGLIPSNSNVGGVDAPVEVIVEEDLRIILSSPKASSNPNDYILAHQEEYENILKQGEDALHYMLSQFKNNNADGLRGHIIMQACKELLGGRDNVSEEIVDPQEWYEDLIIREDVMLPDFTYEGKNPIEKLVYATEVEKNTQPDRGFTIVAPKVFGSFEEDEYLKVFVTTYSATYKLYDNVLEQESGSVVPSAITYKKNKEDKYIIEEYKQAMDGSYFSSSIKEFCTMPVSGKKIIGLSSRILNHYSDYEDIRKLHRENLNKHLNKYGITNVKFED